MKKSTHSVLLTGAAGLVGGGYGMFLFRTIGGELIMSRDSIRYLIAGSVGVLLWLVLLMLSKRRTDGAK
jgi:uncharacterized membrane protein YeaQ/YmgE (transglycosylase-associated protein family)